MENQTEMTAKNPVFGAKKKKKLTTGTIVFYSLYTTFVICVLVLLNLAMKPLEQWLTQYEASQPQHSAEAIYEALFADPDWDLLYDLAGVENTQFEGKEAFIAYMEEKVGDTGLAWQETSAGLSGGKKYIIKMGDEKIAAFSMTASANGDFNAWNLASVEVYFTRTEGATIVTMPEYTVFVNGVALDDSFTTCFVSTLAENYLPEGLHGYRMIRQEISGLLIEPQITVLDENGNSISVSYNAENNVYSTDIAVSPELTQEFYDIALAAAQANAKYAIRAISASDLRQYFDPNTQVYEDISSTPVFLQSYRSYTFDEEATQVTDFYQYSNNLFSARVVLKMDITRKKNDTVKTYEMDTTYFFTRSSSGNWLVTDITNVHVQQQCTQVRLTYMSGGDILQSEMVPADAATLTLPPITAEEGSILIGWARQEAAADGSITYTIVLEPSDDGKAYLPEGQLLESMTLYPVFEEAK